MREQLASMLYQKYKREITQRETRVIPRAWLLVLMVSYCDIKKDSSHKTGRSRVA